jgi:alcohol dehydrogenase
MGEKVEELTVMEAATKASTAIRNLNKDIGIASNLAELGVKESDMEVLAQSAMNDLCRTTNPRRPVTFEDMLFMIRRAMGTGLVKAAGA